VEFEAYEVVRFVEAVKKATGLLVRNVEFSPETKLIRVNVGAPGELTSVEGGMSGAECTARHRL
jgi:hypothetical protein